VAYIEYKIWWHASEGPRLQGCWWSVVGSGLCYHCVVGYECSAGGLHSSLLVTTHSLHCHYCRRRVTSLCGANTSLPLQITFTRPAGLQALCAMSSHNRASADDMEHISSTAIPGQHSTREYPPNSKPNACRSAHALPYSQQNF
jgi:hypothetical protein